MQKYPLIGVCLLVALFVFLLVFGDLRTQPFVQGLSGLLMALITALLLFSVVPSTASLTGQVARPVISLGGAAAFYLLALPSIEPFIFPNVTITGNIYYERDPSQSLTPVAGVLVTVPQTNQQSTPTNSQGWFTVPNVPRGTDRLIAFYGGQSHSIVLKSYKSSEYPVIPRPVVPAPSPKQQIAATEWQVEPRYTCPQAASGERVSAFSLRHKLPGGSGDLARIQVISQGSERIVDAQELAPGTGLEVTEADRQRARQWEFTLPATGLDVKLVVCLSLSGESNPSHLGMRTTYWYLKEK